MTCINDFFRKVASSEGYFAKMRNGIFLTLTLGLGFVFGFLPVLSSNDPSQVKKATKQNIMVVRCFSKYVFVMMNTLSGVVIFLHVWILPKIRDCLKNRNPEISPTDRSYSSSELLSQQLRKPKKTKWAS